MNKTISPVAAGAACLLLSAAAFAAPPAAPATSERNLPLWEAGVGAGFVTTPAYPGADSQNNRGLALPFLIYRGEVLRSDQSGIGARLLRTDVAEFDIGFAASLPAHSKDVGARAGMPNLGTLVEFGPRLKLKVADSVGRHRLRLDARALGGARPRLNDAKDLAKAHLS